MKKTISILLSFLMIASVFTALPFSASALDSGQCGDDVTYSFNSSTGTLTLSGTGNVWFYYSQNPSPFYKNDAIKKVIIGEGITGLGRQDFYGCKNLTTVSFPNTLTFIEDSAFAGCTSLNSITLPSSITKINMSAFWDTGFYDNPSNWVNGVLYIGDILADTNADLTSDEYTVKSGTRLICAGAFSGRKSLTSITIPSSVKIIGEEAFNGCKALKKVNISSLKAWCDITFNHEGYSYYNNYNPLYYAKKLYLNGTHITNLTIPSGVSKINDFAFSGADINSVTIPEDVSEIGESAFFHCKSLTSASFSNGLDSIDREAFRECTKLESVKLPDSLSILDSHAFDSCEALKSVNIPTSLDEIKDQTFSYCNSLESIEIPKNIKKIGYDAFIGSNKIKVKIDSLYNWCKIEFYNICANPLYEYGKLYVKGKLVTNLSIPNSVKTINNFAFAGSSIKTVSIPSGVTTIGSNAFPYCRNLTSIKVDSNNSSFSSKDGVLFTKNKSILRTYPSNKSNTSYTIPSGVKKLSSHSFENVRKLKKITVPKSLNYIDYDALGDSNSIRTAYYKSTMANWKKITVKSHYYESDSYLPGGNDAFYDLNVVATDKHKCVTHEPNNGRVTKQATFKAEGVKTCKCTICGKTVKIKISKLGAPKISKLTKGKKSFTASWKKVSRVEGYQIRYSVYSSFKNAKTKTVKSSKTVKTTVKSLKANKKYFVKIRAYKTINGKKQYSKWSSKKSVKTK